MSEHPFNQDLSPFPGQPPEERPSIVRTCLATAWVILGVIGLAISAYLLGGLTEFLASDWLFGPTEYDPLVALEPMKLIKGTGMRALAGLAIGLVITGIMAVLNGSALFDKQRFLSLISGLQLGAVSGLIVGSVAIAILLEMRIALGRGVFIFVMASAIVAWFAGSSRWDTLHPASTVGAAFLWASRWGCFGANLGFGVSCFGFLLIREPEELVWAPFGVWFSLWFSANLRGALVGAILGGLAGATQAWVNATKKGGRLKTRPWSRAQAAGSSARI